MNVFPQRFKGVFAWVTLHLIPMLVLVPIMAAFLVDREASPEWNKFISHMLGQPPIYANYQHAVMSLRAIPIFGVVICLFVILAEMIVSLFSRVSATFHVLAAWAVGFLASFGLWYLRWIRISVKGRGPPTTEIVRAVIFGIAYALIALAATHVLNRKRREDTQPEVPPHR